MDSSRRYGAESMPSPECVKLAGKLRAYRDANESTLEETRANLDAFGDRFPLPKGLVVEKDDVDGVPAEWLIPKDAHEPGVLYYLHGGGYVIGSIQSHRHMVAAMAEAASMRAFMVDYRLAPEHPFPAGLEDAVSGYHWLLASGHDADKIVLCGDSAGGGLTLATLLQLREEGAPLPKCAVLLSPWTDLTNTLESRITKLDAEPLLSAPGASGNAEDYANGEKLTHPLISPINADLSDLPPMLIQVGTEEILLDDSVVLADRMCDAGVDVQLDVWDGLFHVWQYYPGWLPEAQEAIDEIAAFIRGHIH